MRYIKLLGGLFLIVLVVLMISAPITHADTYSTFQTTRYYSANHRYFIKVDPSKRATLYRKEGRVARRIWSRNLPELPGKLLVANSGKHTVSIDCYYGNGNDPNKPVVLVFDDTGSEIARYLLKDVAVLPRLTMTTSTAYWYESAKFTPDDRLIVVNTVIAKYDRAKCGNINSPEEADKMWENCMATTPYEQLLFIAVTGKLASRVRIAAK